MDDLRCIGCGSVLQSNDPKSIGYVPESALHAGVESEDKDIICRRCFKLRHYNTVTPLAITKEDFYRVVSEIGTTNSLVVNLVDVFDLEGSLIPQIKRLTNHNDLVIIANKRDLLPKAISNSKLLHHIKKVVSDNQLKPVDVLIMSATKRHNLDGVMDKILKHANGRDIYIVGATNVGKSTFINAILKSYASAKSDVITVSQHAGTTLDMIKIPLDDQYVIDTPGIINDVQLTHYVSPAAQKIMLPKKEIKPKGYQLNPEQTLFVNGFARVDFVNGEKTSFICYFSEFIKIHRTKLERADELYETRRYDVLAPPYEGENFKLKKHRMHLKPRQDLVLPGLGFITVKGAVTLDVYIHEKTVPYIREALI